MNNPNFVNSCTVNVSPVDIARIFAAAKNQGEIVINLYKMVVPEWDNVVKMNSFPECNESTWQFICEKFIEFDKKNHPDVIPGGCWLNHGFSVSKDIEDWFVYVDTSLIEYR